MAIRAAKNRANMLEFVVRVRVDHEELAARLMEGDRQPVAVNPDTVVQTRLKSGGTEEEVM